MCGQDDVIRVFILGGGDVLTKTFIQLPGIKRVQAVFTHIVKYPDKPVVCLAIEFPFGSMTVPVLKIQI